MRGKKRSQPWLVVHLHRKERFQKNKGKKEESALAVHLHRKGSRKKANKQKNFLGGSVLGLGFICI